MNEQDMLQSPSSGAISFGWDDLLALNREPCDCLICQRGRKYESIIAKLPSDEREWMSSIYNDFLDTEEELAMIRTWNSDLTDRES